MGDSCNAFYAPVLPAEGWSSIDLYRENYEEFTTRWFPERRLTNLLSPEAELGAMGKWRKRWLRDVAYPKRVASETRGSGAPVHVFDHSYSHLVKSCSPSLVHCRDLNHLVAPSLTGVHLARWKRRLQGIESADLVIAISEQLAGEIAEHTSVSRDRIRIIYHGVDLEKFRPGRQEEAGERFPELAELAKNQFLILNVGTNLVRKDLDSLYAAVVCLRGKGIPVTLVRVGRNDSPGRVEAERIAQAGVAPFLVQMGTRSSDEVALIGSLCHVLSFASRYEGFGRPLLEAQGIGLPLVAAHASCIPEIAGDGALYHKAGDRDELVDRLFQVYSGSDEVGEAVAKGKENVKRFHWREHLRKLFSVYDELS